MWSYLGRPTVNCVKQIQLQICCMVATSAYFLAQISASIPQEKHFSTEHVQSRTKVEVSLCTTVERCIWNLSSSVTEVMGNSHSDCRRSPINAKIPHLRVHRPKLRKQGTALVTPYINVFMLCNQLGNSRQGLWSRVFLSGSVQLSLVLFPFLTISLFILVQKNFILKYSLGEQRTFLMFLTLVTNFLKL